VKPNAMRCTFFSLAISCSLIASIGHASDGRTEINQAAALAGGISPSDAPGFPVSLFETGGYVLTSNLSVSAEGVDAIDILVQNVNLDLNGFEIIGPISCTGSGLNVVCDEAASSIGIDASRNPGATVRDGSVRGFRRGASLGGRSIAHQLTVSGNVLTGLSVDNGIVSQCTANQNGGLGFNVNAGSLIRGSTASGNKDAGIFANVGSSVIGNVSFRNGRDGIATSSDVLVRDNTVRDNSDLGLRLGDGSGYVGNVINDNNGTVSGGTAIGLNVCNGNTTCP